MSIDANQHVFDLDLFEQTVKWSPECAGVPGKIDTHCTVAAGRGTINQHIVLGRCFPRIEGMRDQDQYPRNHSTFNGLNNDARHLYTLAHSLGIRGQLTLAEICSPAARAYAELYMVDYKGKPESRHGTNASRYQVASLLPRALWKMWVSSPEASRTDPLWGEVLAWQDRYLELFKLAKAEQKARPPKDCAAPAALNGQAKRAAISAGAVNIGHAGEIAAATELLHLIVPGEGEDDEEIPAGQRYSVLVNTMVACIGPAPALPNGERPNLYHPSTADTPARFVRFGAGDKIKEGKYLGTPVAEYTLTAAAAAVIDPVAVASQSGWLFERKRTHEDDSWQCGGKEFQRMMGAATKATAKHAGIAIRPDQSGARGFRKMKAQRTWDEDIAGEPDAKKRKENLQRYKTAAGGGAENLVATYAAAPAEPEPAAAAAPAEPVGIEERIAALERERALLLREQELLAELAELRK